MAHRVGVDEMGNQPAADFDPSIDTSLLISASSLSGAKDGDLVVRTGTSRVIASSSAAASANSFGSRRAELLPDVPWLTDISVANLRVANANKWREDPRMIVPVVGYLEQFDLEAGDLVTLAWSDEEGGFLYPQLNGVKKFLVLPTPIVTFPGSEMAKASLSLIQVDL